MRDDDVRRLEEQAETKRRELDETLSRLERARAEESVAHLSPEQRRRRIREWTRRIGIAVPAAMLIGWLRQKPVQAVTAGAMAAATGVIAVGPVTADRPGPDVGLPRAPDAAVVVEQPGPAVEVTATVAPQEPDTAMTPIPPERDAVAGDSPESGPTTVPQQPEVRRRPPAEDAQEPGPTPEPEPEPDPAEPPEQDDPETSCLLSVELLGIELDACLAG